MPLEVWQPTDLEVSRLEALRSRLTALGYLGAEGAHLVWQQGETRPTVTIEPRDNGAQAVIDAWDWSKAAQDALDRKTARAKAQASLTTTTEGIPIAARNTARALFRSLIETRSKLNEVIGYLNGTGATIEPLINRTFAQAIMGTSQLIDSETDPTGS